MAASVSTDLILRDVSSTGKEIGRGAYGRVFEVDYQGTLCAAKEVHELLLQYSQGEALRKITADFLNECQIWSTIRHPCIVQFLGVYYPARDQYRLPVMVMEKMQHSLRGLVEKYANIPLNVKLSILDEVCLGLRYLHSRNPQIVHRDLTPNNILLGRSLEAKITDLGVAKVMQVDKKSSMTKIPGTPDFMPPEALTKRPVYGPPLDVFSYGGVVLSIITQQWPEPSDQVQLNTVTDQWEMVSEVTRRRKYLDMFTGTAKDLIPIVSSCLNGNPGKRPTVTQVSTEIKRIKDVCSQQPGHDGMSPIVWWAEVSGQSSSQQQVTSLTTQLESMTVSNEELRRQNDGLKVENDAFKREIAGLKMENTRVKVKNSGLKVEVDGLKSEVTQLKSGLQEQLVQSPTSDLLSGPVNIKWQDGAPAPVKDVYHTAVLCDRKVYIVGGYGSPDRIDIYTPASNSWSPSPIYNHYRYFAMAILNNQLITAGGMDRSDKVTDKIFSLDGDHLKEYTRMIIGRHSTIAAGYQGMLIITGGKDDHSTTIDSTEIFNSTTRQWYTTCKLPSPHCRLQSLIVDNELYLLGGLGISTVFTAPLDSLSSHRLEWSSQKDTPGHSSAPVSIQGRHLLTVGGVKKTGSGYMRTSDIHKFNKITQSWEVIGRIPSARYGSAVVSVADDKIVVVGGYDDEHCSTNTVWIGSFES